MKTLTRVKGYRFTKNLIVIIAAFSILLFIGAPAFAQSSFTIGLTSYIIDGKSYSMDVAPYIKNGRTFMPVRYVASSLGLPDSDIVWDEASQKVTLLKGSKVVQVAIGSREMVVNGVIIVMDTAPEVAGGRVMLPLSYIARAFGASITWNEKIQQVTIFSGSESIEVPDPTTNNWLEPNSNTFSVTYKWTFKNREIKWGPFHIPVQTINKYREKPHPYFTPGSSDIFDQVYTYTSDTDGDEILTTIVDGLKNYAAKAGYDEKETVDFVVAFVQGLPYVSDEVSTSLDEYPRYPVETLLDREGDCEDTAMLTAVLLRKLGYGTAFLILPDIHHAAVGILGSQDAYGTYYEHDGKKYLYLETTRPGWKIGQIPESYKDAKAYVIPLP